MEWWLSKTGLNLGKYLYLLFFIFHSAKGRRLHPTSHFSSHLISFTLWTESYHSHSESDQEKSSLAWWVNLLGEDGLEEVCYRLGRKYLHITIKNWSLPQSFFLMFLTCLTVCVIDVDFISQTSLHQTLFWEENKKTEGFGNWKTSWSKHWVFLFFCKTKKKKEEKKLLKPFSLPIKLWLEFCSWSC